MMDADQQLAHIERISSLADALTSLPWISPDEQQAAAEILLEFDGIFWTFTNYLSLPLYSETEKMLRQYIGNPQISARPKISVIMPVYKAQRDLLESALRSLRLQIGVALEVLISIDGLDDDLTLVEAVLESLDRQLGVSPHVTTRLIFSQDNLGVGRCRNRALSETSGQWFTCLDSDDIFHPLRCLHSLLALLSLGVDRLNTSWSRVSLRQKKIVLINGRLSTYGHNSFLARTDVLRRFGFMANLRVHEDTEYQQRLAYFGASMQNSPIIGHYLHTEPDSSYSSLSTPLRRETDHIQGHPYLCGSVIYGRDHERHKIERMFAEIYSTIFTNALLSSFPPG